MIVVRLEEVPGRLAERRYAKRVQLVDWRDIHRVMVDEDLLVVKAKEETLRAVHHLEQDQAGITTAVVGVGHADATDAGVVAFAVAVVDVDVDVAVAADVAVETGNLGAEVMVVPVWT